MNKAVMLILAVALLLAFTPPLAAQGGSGGRKTKEAILESQIEALLKTQKEDGRWEHSYELGMTALAVLALKHSNEPRAATAVGRGVEYISQAKTEYKTYSAGMIISALYQVNPRAYSRVIGKYSALLEKSQVGSGPGIGMFGYNLVGDPNRRGGDQPDNSNTQFAVLGLLFADRAGHQVPKRIWENLRKHYTTSQNTDGGWGYRLGNNSTHTMTLAGAVSLYIAEEHLEQENSDGCKMAPPSRGTEAAMKWVGQNFATDISPYGLYGIERLGILTGRSEFGGHYWYKEGVNQIVNKGMGGAGIGGGDADAAFLVLFLSRGKEPIVINKLKYYGDWNNTNYDVKHITDYISDRMQSPMQWRIVTLESKLDELLEVPILHYNGIKGPAFTDDEKIKIRNYVLRGGTLMAQACDCKGAEEFDQAFRALMEECLPESELEELPASHPMFQNPRKVAKPPKVEVMKFEKGRIGVMYLPKSIVLDWHRGGASVKASLDVGVNMVFFILKQAGRLKAGAKPIAD